MHAPATPGTDEHTAAARLRRLHLHLGIGLAALIVAATALYGATTSVPLRAGTMAVAIAGVAVLVAWANHRARRMLALEANPRASGADDRITELAQAFAGVLDPIASIDEGGRVLFVNPAVERVFGWKPEELLGNNVNVLMGQPYREEHDGYIAAYLSTGEAKAIGRIRKVLGRRRDGTEFPCELSVSEMRMRDGTRRFVGMVRDISEREQLAARLAHTERLAAVGELAASVAHEVNNPVNTIINCAQLIKDGDTDPEVLDYISQEGARIASIVRDLLDFTRDRHDELSAAWVPDVLRRTLSLVQGRIEKNGIRVRVEVERDLPALHTRPQQLQQVLLNLLLNARDALVDGGKAGAKEIVVRAAAAGPGHVQITVRDNGRGIPTENRERIFQPFFTTKGARGGNGLGLAVSRGIVQEHGGTLTVDSVPGEYSEFVVRIPVHQDNGDEDHGSDRPDR